MLFGNPKIYKELELRKQLYQICQDEYFRIKRKDGSIPRFLAKTPQIQQQDEQFGKLDGNNKQKFENLQNLYKADPKSKISVEQKEIIGKMV